MLHKAKAALETADAVFRRSLVPQQWAIVQRNLGVVYLRLGELATGAESERLYNRAIVLIKSSLAVQNPAFQPLDWAVTQQNICLALHDLGRSRGQAGIADVKEAIGHCRKALHWLSPEGSPLDWAMAQNNLAVAEAILAQLQSNKTNLTAAITAFKKSQKVYTKRDLPVNWAMIETNLGELYCHLARAGADGADFKPALAHTGQALEVFLDRKVTRYQQYAKRQLAAIKSCEAGDSAQCRCNGG